MVSMMLLSNPLWFMDSLMLLGNPPRFMVFLMLLSNPPWSHGFLDVTKHYPLNAHTSISFDFLYKRGFSILFWPDSGYSADYLCRITGYCIRKNLLIIFRRNPVYAFRVQTPIIFFLILFCMLFFGKDRLG